MPSSYTISDYKVGIVCALPLERTAIQAMLDELHDSQAAIFGDNNMYSFGSIGPHKVVVASLGAGKYGTVSAADVANDIRRSFPQLKYGLMVGIAGAIPRPESEDGDIRLGDIVVGCANGVPSIVNYNFGKDTVDGFDIRSEFAEPPEALVRAVASLQSQHQMSGPTYLIHLSNMLKKNPRLNQPKVRRDYYNIPDSTDRLYKARAVDFMDTNGDGTASTAGASEIVREHRYLRFPPDGLTFEKFVRIRYDGFADYPAVFLGSIGSADTLVKSAVRRDAIYHMVKQQRKADLLCLEMEASGLVRGWPCLVIRGICDYCDSHKNDVWQNFAAATAAAYAKDLLLRIPADVVVGARPVNEVVQRETSPDQPPSILRLASKPRPLPDQSVAESSQDQTSSRLRIESNPLPQESCSVAQRELNQQLIDAIRTGDFEKLKYLHSIGGDINSSHGPAWGRTALCAADSSYHREGHKNHEGIFQIIRYLVEHGADVKREHPSVQETVWDALQFYWQVEHEYVDEDEDEDEP